MQPVNVFSFIDILGPSTSSEKPVIDHVLSQTEHDDNQLH
jgi:hypothetical protein